MLTMRIVRREEPAEAREECLTCGRDLTHAARLYNLLLIEPGVEAIPTGSFCTQRCAAAARRTLRARQQGGGT